MVSFSTGLIFVTLIVISRKKTRAGFGLIFKAVGQKKLPKWRLLAGVLGSSFVAMQTHVVPIAGVALFTVASLAGQTAISLFVDKLGLSGGAKIGAITSGKGADKAGIPVNSIIKTIDGYKINDAVSAIVRIRAKAPGDQVTVVVELPSGSSRTYTVTLDSAPSL